MDGFDNLQGPIAISWDWPNFYHLLMDKALVVPLQAYNKKIAHNAKLGVGCDPM